MTDQTNQDCDHLEATVDLQASELFYRRLFEGARDGIVVLDADSHRITDANPATVELLGNSREALLGKELWEVGLFKTREQGQAALRELLASGYLRCEDLKLETKTGEFREVELIGSVYGDDSHRAVQCNLRDLTESKRAEAAQHEENDLLAIAQSVGRMGNWNLDLLSERLTWSAATCDLFGITPDEFRQTFEHFRSFILPEDRPSYLFAHRSISPAAPVLETEYRIQRADGEVRWLFERGRIEFDAGGKPIRGVGIVMDITERHAVREKLIHNAALLAQIAGRVARLGGWSIELPERKLAWSDENCAIHDLPPGHTPTLEEGIDFFPPEHRAEVIRCVEVCARDGTPYDFELPKHTATGRLIWVRSIGEAVRDDSGQVIRLQGAFQDITQRKVAEVEREKLIKELQNAVLEVSTLREFLPICSYCKKVRDDQQYWTQIESYISKHTTTKFSHGICPECYDNEVEPQLEEIRRQRQIDDGLAG